MYGIIIDIVACKDRRETVQEELKIPKGGNQNP